MMRLACATAFAVLLAPSTVLAEDPEYIREYSGQLGNCRPSCYDNESSVKWDASDYKKVCGYRRGAEPGVRVIGRPRAGDTTSARPRTGRHSARKPA